MKDASIEFKTVESSSPCDICGSTEYDTFIGDGSNNIRMCSKCLGENIMQMAVSSADTLRKIKSMEEKMGYDLGHSKTVINFSIELTGLAMDLAIVMSKVPYDSEERDEVAEEEYLRKSALAFLRMGEFCTRHKRELDKMTTHLVN
jgi:hypothetical protein